MSEDKLRIDVSVLLPEVPHARDQCVDRLQQIITAKEGIDDAHLVEASEEQPDQFCIHFDPQRFSLGEIRDLARRVGVDLSERYGHLVLETHPMHARQARTTSSRITRIRGVLESEVSPDGIARIEYDRRQTNEKALRQELQRRKLLPATAQEAEKDSRDAEEEESHTALFGMDLELPFAVLSGALLLIGWLLPILIETSSWLPLSCYVGAFFFGGFFTLWEMVENLRAGRLEIDFLMLVASVGAASLGEWAEGALLLFLFSLGHALEHYAMGRARRAIKALAEVAPKTALVRREGREEERPVEELEVGDTVIIKPNARIPADGVVVKGESSVDQSPVTGESVPVDKRPGDRPSADAGQFDKTDHEHRVFAGTINGSGALEVLVAKRAKDTTLARVVQMVTEAETQKSPTQRFTDRFERVFVPSVLALVLLLLFAWVVLDEPFTASFYRAMAVLVAASPCALAIATPSAVLSAVARAGRGGLLVKGGRPLENLGRLQAIAFDKTGTLTEGKPRLMDVVPAEGVSEQELLRVAVAVERLSDHPLAAAVVRGGTQSIDSNDVPSASDLQSITGRGVRAMLDNEMTYVGKDDLFDEVDGPPLPEGVRRAVSRLEGEGRTTMIVRHGQRYLGVLGLMDKPRDSAASVIEALRDLGIRRMVMISGDNQRVAEAVAKQVGLDEGRGDLLPEDKVETIKQLRREQLVAMVGDGVNDAPAMANATVGIAMGAAGSEVALETADVALMADDLRQLPFAVGLSRRTSGVIRQNLWLSLGMVAFLIPATVLGLGIGPAVALHEGSTLVVVLNALRLLNYRGSLT